MAAIRRLSQFEVILVLLIYIPLVAAAYVAADRYGVEMRNREVGLAVDGADLYALLATGPAPPADTLARLAARRTLVAMSEDTVATLLDSGQVTLVPGSASTLTLFTPDAALAERLRVHLGVKLQLPVQVQPVPTGYRVHLPASRDLLDKVGVGLPPARTQTLRQLGLGIVARLRNYPGVSAQAVEFTIAQAAGQGAQVAVFDGEEVLGYPTLIATCAKALEASNLAYGSVEFAKQRGDERLGRKLDGSLVRVHSITGAEMATMNPADTVDRFLRAVRERNIRLCYLRSYSGSRATASQLFADMDAVSEGLVHSGFGLAAPRPLSPFSEPVWLRLLVAVAPVAGAVLLLGLIVPLSARARLALFMLGLLAGWGLLLAAPGLGAKEKALLGAIVFPSISLVLLARTVQSEPSPGGVGALILRGLLMLLTVSLISAGGALTTVAMLSERLYLVKVDQFSGIKLANLVPLLLVALVAAGYLYADHLSLRQWWALVRTRLARLFARPVLAWQVLAAALALGALAFFVLRTGNEPGVGVSGLEMRFRGFLEQYLPARPRTKEFLIGHPALMLAVALGLTGRRRWLVPVLVVAAIGQVSLVNTFCHIHTPIALSLTRSLVGLGLGAVVGALVVLAWWLAVGRLAKWQAPPSAPAGQ